jgi:hypothetical protein
MSNLRKYARFTREAYPSHNQCTLPKEPMRKLGRSPSSLNVGLVIGWIGNNRTYAMPFSILIYFPQILNYIFRLCLFTLKVKQFIIIKNNHWHYRARWFEFFESFKATEDRFLDDVVCLVFFQELRCAL